MNKIVLKFGSMIMVLFLAVLLPLGYVANQVFTNFYYSQAQEEVNELAEKYALSISSVEDGTVLNMFLTLADLTGKEIYVLDEEGNVAAASGIQLANLSDGELLLLLEGQPVQKRFHDAEGDNYLGSGYPIVNAGVFEGAIFVLTPIDEIQAPLGKIRDLLILSAAGALFLALGFTFLLSKKMSDPLLEMEKATREIAKGNLDIQVKIPSNDEVGSLGRAINDLALETNRYRSNRKEFFANISHELRTPISYIQGYTHVLKQGLYQTEAEKVQYLNILETETRRIVRLINDLFDLSKMEEGKVDLQLRSIDVAEVIENVLLKIKIAAQEKGITINPQIEEGLPGIKADGVRMEQIVTNLLGNAIQYTESGTVSVKAKKEENEVVISVEDTGSGIPEDELPFIFERFHRVDKSRARELGGTGLGLAIVKNLVELQQGTVSVFSEQGEGTTFTLRFPAA